MVLIVQTLKITKYCLYQNSKYILFYVHYINIYYCM